MAPITNESPRISKLMQHMFELSNKLREDFSKGCQELKIDLNDALKSEIGKVHGRVDEMERRHLGRHRQHYASPPRRHEPPRDHRAERRHRKHYDSLPRRHEPPRAHREEKRQGQPRRKLEDQHSKNSAPHQTKATKSVAQTSNSSGQPRVHNRELTCFKCKGRGHYAKECPDQQVMLGGQDGMWYSKEEEEKNEELCPETFIGFAEEEDDHEGVNDAKHSLVVTKSFEGGNGGEEVYNHRETPFHMQVKVLDKICLTMVDGGSCANVVARSLVDELQLPKTQHPQPYKLRWLGNFGEVKVAFQCLVPLIIGEYHENVLCDVLPMDACHVLLGRPWEFDSNALRDCRTNEYVLRCGQGNVRLKPLSPHLAQKAHEKLMREQMERGNPKVVKDNYKELATKKELNNCSTNHASPSALSFALLGTKVGIHSMAKSQDQTKVHGARVDKVGVLDSMKNPFQEGGNDVDSHSIMLKTGPQEPPKKLVRKLTKKRRRRRKTRNTNPGNPTPEAPEAPPETPQPSRDFPHPRQPKHHPRLPSPLGISRTRGTRGSTHLSGILPLPPSQQLQSASLGIL